MWPNGERGDEDDVTCIGCGGDVGRAEAREYDKYGDRWDRSGKDFEYLCKECYRELCHQPREDLEGLLVELEAGEVSREEFYERFASTVEERYGSIEE